MRSEVATRPPIRSLHRLREEIRAIEDRTPGRPASDDAADRAAALPTGWGEGHPGSLARAAIHEWFGPHDESAGNRKRRQAPWSPPLGVFAHLAHRAQRNDPSRPALIWIGRRCWIHPHALLAQDENTTPPLLASSIFVDAATDAERVWAADMALRCRAAGVVVMDATRLDMAASRRLLLAAQCGGAIGLLARPPDEMNRLSAARTRWVVRSAPSPSDGVRWTLELIRCRDAGFTPGRAKALTLERSHETGHVGVVADVFDRSDAASRPAPRRRTA